MTNYLFLIHCNKCNNDMKYSTNTKILTGKNKRCVYCGKNIVVNTNLIREL